MAPRLSNVFTLALALAAATASGHQASPIDQPDSVEEEITVNFTPEGAIKQGIAETDVRNYLRTCVEDAPVRDYFLALSERYVDFLAQFGRVGRAEVEAAASAPSTATPVCGVNESAVLQTLRDRESSIRLLTASPTPPEPASSAPAPSSDPPQVPNEGGKT